MLCDGKVQIYTVQHIEAQGRNDASPTLTLQRLLPWQSVCKKDAGELNLPEFILRLFNTLHKFLCRDFGKLALKLHEQ